MPAPNPGVAKQLEQAKVRLAELKEEKARLYPANPHPFVEPDRYPRDYTPEQIQHRNQLVKQIEDLEKNIEDLQDRLFTK